MEHNFFVNCVIGLSELVCAFSLSVEHGEHGNTSVLGVRTRKLRFHGECPPTRRCPNAVASSVEVSKLPYHFSLCLERTANGSHECVGSAPRVRIVVWKMHCKENVIMFAKEKQGFIALGASVQKGDDSLLQLFDIQAPKCILHTRIIESISSSWFGVWTSALRRLGIGDLFDTSCQTWRCQENIKESI